MKTSSHKPNGSVGHSTKRKNEIVYCKIRRVHRPLNTPAIKKTDNKWSSVQFALFGKFTFFFKKDLKTETLLKQLEV